MADSQTQSVSMRAAPRDIMAAVADFAAYPRWADAIKTVTVVDPGTGGRAARVQFTIDAGIIKDTYVLAYTWAPDDLSVTWKLVSGQIQKSQHGSYVLRPVRDAAEADGPRTEVTYSLSVELSIPLIGVIRRKAERVIMQTALSELRNYVEGRR